MNLSDVEKEIVGVVSADKEIELLYDPEYPLLETMPKFIKWITKGTYDIEEE